MGFEIKFNFINLSSLILTIIIVLFFVMIAFMGLSEWWNVQIEHDINSYAWGETNENPWYYHSPVFYSTYMLIEGLLMSLFVILGTKEIFKNKTRFSYWFLLCFVLFGIMIISSNISYY